MRSYSNYIEKYDNVIATACTIPKDDRLLSKFHKQKALLQNKYEPENIYFAYFVLKDVGQGNQCQFRH